MTSWPPPLSFAIWHTPLSDAAAQAASTASCSSPMIAAMAQERLQLEARNGELEARNSDLEASTTQLEAVNKMAAQRIARLTEILKELRRARYGRRSERLSERISPAPTPIAPLLREIIDRKLLTAHAVYGFFPANSDGDNRIDASDSCPLEYAIWKSGEPFRWMTPIAEAA
jgi:hypothetical protein